MCHNSHTTDEASNILEIFKVIFLEFEILHIKSDIYKSEEISMSFHINFKMLLRLKVI